MCGIFIILPSNSQSRFSLKDKEVHVASMWRIWNDKHLDSAEHAEA